ncbi:hypothetical protein EDB82DRAFT_158118 [Fusarium venenatum]|uniref:uncharacterized protein n=1 Tax=Fusarium venenatum TaxID=56646 RepID=UPI001D26A83C|nr:hypothetical protein EDB82DRAFT_158118 [Fusarium venenatum]
MHYFLFFSSLDHVLLAASLDRLLEQAIIGLREWEVQRLLLCFFIGRIRHGTWLEERKSELVGCLWAAEDGISLLAFNGIMRHSLGAAQRFGQRVFFFFFEMTYFICSLSFDQRYESVADLRSKNKQRKTQAGMRLLLQLVRLLSAVKHALWRCH